MRYSKNGMPVVSVIATEWKLRAAVRAELRERGIDALGMDSAEDVGRAVAGGTMPGVVVLEANAELAGDAAVQSLVGRVPTIWELRGLRLWRCRGWLLRFTGRCGSGRLLRR